MKPTSIALALAALGNAAFAAPETGVEAGVETAPINIIGSTPLPGFGVPRDQIPANVQSVGGRRLEEAENLTLPEFMATQLPSVNVNEIQGNPFQADLNYRGFTASPLLGTPQGLSVYLDGVRVNEPFGDTVNWDLLPRAAIAGIDLIPGSNPLFGLNTLGGALAFRTKSGDTHPGTQIELSGGSFGRRMLELETGGKSGPLAWYAAGNWFKEDGWRDYSPSEVKQFFGKLSWRGSDGEADLSLNRTSTALTGNGLLPESMFAQGRSQVFTHPDQTNNDLTQVALSGRYWLTGASSLSGTVYYRQTKTRTLNGDINNEFEGGPFDGVSDDESGVYNRTQTTQNGYGAAAQWNYSGEQHQLAVGVSGDFARMNFSQSAQLGTLDSSRGIGNLAAEEEVNSLSGRTRTTSLYATDTITLRPDLHLTAAARYNRTQVTTVDQLNSVAPNLDGDYTYHKLNPALGLTWQALPTLNVYAGFNQGNRAPSPIELGCADPANPCTLPNSMAADPYLKQVVARTVEAGLRGKFVGGVQWNAGAYRTINTDDILFVGTSTSAGYFTNFGQTRRQGVELGLAGEQGRFDWRINYSYLNATFQSSACLLSASNSSRGQSAECPASDEIFVQKGDIIPGLPAHTLKLALTWRATDKLRLGADVQAFSGQYARGNENNQHQADNVEFFGSGRLPGYGILSLNGTLDLGAGWEIFANINNVFDKRYGTAAALAENPFNSAGAFQNDSSSWTHETFLAPGAPRAAWIGVRFRFGKT